MRVACSILLLCLAAGSAGCETLRAENCDPSPAANPDITYEGGETDHCFYSSSTPSPTTGSHAGSIWGGELLYFPGGMRYALEHRLGCAPQQVQAWVSFEQFGTRNGGNVAPAAGDQVNVFAADATTIRVANDGCSDYWLLVTASVDPASCSLCR